MPWRRLWFWALPWLPSARENRGYHERLYANWGAICDHVRAMGPYDRDDGSFSAIIGTMTEPETGAGHATASLIPQHHPAHDPSGQDVCLLGRQDWRNSPCMVAKYLSGPPVLRGG